jgi:ParB/RepB/Spo0J family partition protein
MALSATQIAQQRVGRAGTPKADAVKVNPNSRIVHRDRLHFMPGQPRTYFDPKKGEELRASLKAKGQLQALIVRPWKDHTGHVAEGHYEVVGGERRVRYSEPARDWKGLSEFIVEVRQMSDVEAFLASLAENLDRHDLTTYDEVRAVARLRDDFNMSMADIQTQLHQERGWVQNRWNASKMTEALQNHLKKPDSLSKALEIAKAPNAKLMDQLTEEFDSLTVQDVKQRITEYKLMHAPHLVSKPKEPAPSLDFDGQGSDERINGYEPAAQYRASGYESNAGITTGRTSSRDRFIQSPQGSKRVYSAPEVLPSALPAMLERTEEGLQYFAQQYERLSSNGSYDVLTQNQMLTRLENILRYAEAGIEAIHAGQQGRRKR